MAEETLKEVFAFCSIRLFLQSVLEMAHRHKLLFVSRLDPLVTQSDREAIINSPLGTQFLIQPDICTAAVDSLLTQHVK